MDYEAFAHRFLYLFYLIGFSACNPCAAHTIPIETWKTRLIQFVPTFFYLALTITLCIVSEYEQSHSSYFVETTNTIVAFMLIFSECILNFTVIGQTIWFRRHFQRMCRKYIIFEKYIHVRLNHSVEFMSFQSSFCRVVGLQLLPFLVTLIVRKTLLSFTVNLMLENMLMMSKFLAIVVNLHIIIHVKLLNFFYAFAVDWLKTQVTLFSAPRAINAYDSMASITYSGRNKMHQMKFIHFKLWDISRSINRIFGWSMAAIIFRNWVEAAYSVYWIYLYWMLDHNKWTLLRKYVFQS